VSKARRHEEKKRRREKRKSKSLTFEAARKLDRVLSSLKRHLDVPTPETWPGACHPSLARPDEVKFEIAEAVQKAGRPHDLSRQLERQLQQGLLGEIPDIDHWGMEEFLWHGMPDGSHHPIDAFVRSAGDQYPPEAREQILRWKLARIGLYHIGDVADDTVAMREWDAVGQEYAGAPFRAIALNIGGVNHYRSQKGLFNVTYVAPWAPERNLYFAMGYGLSIPKELTAPMEYLVRGMRDLPAATFPLPWKMGRVAQMQCLEEWRRRDWHGWMLERLQFPFMALAFIGKGRTAFVRIDSMITRNAIEARQIGLYFGGQIDREEALAAGGTALSPIDLRSPSAVAFAEYQQYRKLVGPAPRW
jgi:hypothetical protein